MVLNLPQGAFNTQCQSSKICTGRKIPSRWTQQTKHFSFLWVGNLFGFSCALLLPLVWNVALPTEPQEELTKLCLPWWMVTELHFGPTAFYNQILVPVKDIFNPDWSKTQSDKKKKRKKNKQLRIMPASVFNTGVSGSGRTTKTLRANLILYEVTSINLETR